MIKKAEGYTQRDNPHSPESECMLTSGGSCEATILNFLGIEHGELDDELIEVFRSNEKKWYDRKSYYERKYNDNYGSKRPDQIWPVAAEIINEHCQEMGYPIKATWRWLTDEKKKKFLDEGCLLMESTSLCGLAHVISKIGYDDEKETWTVIDTYGNAEERYRKGHQDVFIGEYRQNNKGFKSPTNCITLEITK